jgi:lysophospholipase L1-like esterase
MNRRRTLLLLLVAFATACGGPPKLPRLSQDAVVLAFGDSLTFGTGANPNESYPARLEALIGRKVVGSGIPGEVSAEGLARLSSVLDETRPQLLVLCHGGNDLLRKLDDAQAANNLRAMVRLAKARGAQVLLIGVPKPGLLPSPADFYEDIAREFKLPYEGAALRKVLTDNALKSDLVHPNAAGYAKLAEAVAALLKKAGAV